MACQISGLLSFLQKKYENLLTVDIICHGVPTPKYWQKYIEKKKVDRINFRAKDKGWENYTYGIKINDEYINYKNNKFMRLYIRNYMLRPCCYECFYKTKKLSDITSNDCISTLPIILWH